MNTNTVLVTGGAGYIGSHTCLELLKEGYEVVVIDNFSNSCVESLKRVEELTTKRINIIEGDVRDKLLLSKIFSNFEISAVIHFAGFKAVGESCSLPLNYYDNNIGSTLCLTQVMAENKCKKLIFSSSATVYGNPIRLPITENMPLSATNPYGRSKLIIEDILRDLCQADIVNECTNNDPWSIALLRYFNPVGAHKSGRIGEDPSQTPNNLMPFITQTAIGRRKALTIFGKDYETKDGTGVRDYIHVVDLAKGHVKTVDKLLSAKGVKGIQAYNLGTGVGISVLDMVKAFMKINKIKVMYKFSSRRSGDIASCYADASLAKHELNWKAVLTIKDMVRDSWHWQNKNPNGYR